MRQFPIYSVSVKWEEDDGTGGRRPNTYSFADRMERKRLSDAEIDEAKTDLLSRMMEKHADKHPSGAVVEMKHTHDEEWCLVWFSHQTFDDGQTDDEAMASFASFVDRTRQFNRENQIHSESGYGYDPRCLMGAEDMWRWRSDTGNPPCRCEHCKKAGVLRVDH